MRYPTGVEYLYQSGVAQNLYFRRGEGNQGGCSDRSGDDGKW